MSEIRELIDQELDAVCGGYGPTIDSNNYVRVKQVSIQNGAVIGPNALFGHVGDASLSQSSNQTASVSF
jgi:hypothetical protein